MKNVYYNYRLASYDLMPGYRRVCECPADIAALALCPDGILALAGKGLYLISKRKGDGACRPLARLESANAGCISPAGDRCFITDGDGLSVVWEGKQYLLMNHTSVGGCRLGVIMGDRLILSGNPSCPRRVFYLPLDRGVPVADEVSYTDEGADVLSLIPSGGYLWLLTDRPFGQLVLRRVGEELSTPSLVREIDLPPVIAGGVRMYGEIFILTAAGLFSIDTSRPETATPTLRMRRESSEKYGSVRLLPWQGYLMLIAEDSLLIDPREPGCESYPIDPPVCYVGDKRVYKYSPEAADGYDIHDHPHSPINGEAYSLIDEGGRTVYFSPEGRRRYAIYPTDETAGGDPVTPTLMLSDGEDVCFGINGSLYLYNSPAEEQEADYYYRAGRRAPSPGFYLKHKRKKGRKI